MGTGKCRTARRLQSNPATLYSSPEIKRTIHRMLVDAFKLTKETNGNNARSFHPSIATTSTSTYHCSRATRPHHIPIPSLDLIITCGDAQRILHTQVRRLERDMRSEGRKESQFKIRRVGFSPNWMQTHARSPQHSVRDARHASLHCLR